MTTFNSSLPDDLLKLLNEKAKMLSLPKNKIIEKALRIYLEQLNKAEYVKSFKQIEKDKDLLMKKLIDHPVGIMRPDKALQNLMKPYIRPSKAL
jgi:hypothetical protein